MHSFEIDLLGGAHHDDSRMSSVYCRRPHYKWPGRCLPRLMAAWTSSFRLLEAPAPALAATQSNYSQPVGRPVSRRDKPATHSHG